MKWCSPTAGLVGAAGELIFLSDLKLADWADLLEEAEGLGEEGSVMVRINDLIVFVCDDPEWGSPYGKPKENQTSVQS